MEKLTKILKRDNGKQWLSIADQMLRLAWEWKGDVAIQIKPHKQGRSQAQNRLLWKWHSEFQKHIQESQGQTFDTEEIHEFIVGKLLPRKAITMPDGEPVIVRASTKKLKVAEFAEFLSKYEMLCADSYGLQLTKPDDLYWQALMRDEK